MINVSGSSVHSVLDEGNWYLIGKQVILKCKVSLCVIVFFYQILLLIGSDLVLPSFMEHCINSLDAKLFQFVD